MPQPNLVTQAPPDLQNFFRIAWDRRRGDFENNEDETVKWVEVCSENGISTVEQMVAAKQKLTGLDMQSLTHRPWFAIIPHWFRTLLFSQHVTAAWTRHPKQPPSSDPITTSHAATVETKDTSRGIRPPQASQNQNREAPRHEGGRTGESKGGKGGKGGISRGGSQGETLRRQAEPKAHRGREQWSRSPNAWGPSWW